MTGHSRIGDEAIVGVEGVGQDTEEGTVKVGARAMEWVLMLSSRRTGTFFISCWPTGTQSTVL